MTNLTNEQILAISAALTKLNEAAQEIASALVDSDYTLESAPDFLQDPETFSYDIMTMVEDELETIKEVNVSVTQEQVVLAVGTEIADLKVTAPLCG